MYSSIHNKFVISLDGILLNNFHLIVITRLNYIFDWSSWEYNGHLDHWFSNFLYSIWNLHERKLYALYSNSGLLFA